MKKKYKKPFVNISLSTALAWMAVLIVVGSIMSYELVEYGYYTFFSSDKTYSPICGVGMFLPMSILSSLLVGKFLRMIYSYILELTNGISEIAKGNFIRLDESKGGPLSDIYHSVNTMSAELSSMDTLRNEFVNEFSHEFKTPLSAINGFANLLLDRSCSKEQTAQYLTIISQESERLLDLTKSQLLLTKLDAQQIIPDRKNYALDEQLRQCMILLSSQWEAKNLDVSLALTPITIYANYALLQHVWINLINNAVKYTPDNGKISISSSLSDNRVSILISDTGVGMTQEEAAHIFTKYYRAQKDIKGLGLGLSIVKRIVELSSGTIDVKSAPGEGSAFRVTLPLS